MAQEARTMPHGASATAKRQSRFLMGIGIDVSALSGLLLAAAMPNVDVSVLGWAALVPLLLMSALRPQRRLR